MGEEILDVAIVGAGVSGIWCGWRLLGDLAGAGQKKRVAVFEMSDRVGGRLLSVEMPGVPGVACELGGMRYMSTQPIVSWLVEKELGLKPEPAPVSEDANIAYLRGKHLHIGDLGNPELVPYNLTGSDVGKLPDTLLEEAVAKVVPAVKHKTGRELRKAVQEATFEGRPVWEQGFWNLLARTMAAEAYRFSEAAGGYDTVMLNWNGADTILLNFDFTPGVQYHRIVGGYEQVPTMLCDRFTDAGGELRTLHQARSVEAVTLDDGTSGVRLGVEDLTTGQSSVVAARAAILAMPRRALEMLSPTGNVLGDATFRDLLGTVTPIPLYKAFVAYHEPWWEEVGVSAGRSVTDLPLRQVYYWGSLGSDANSILLASYNDTLNVSFWQGLANDDARYHLTVDHLPAERQAEITAHGVDPRWESFKAPAALVAELHDELVEMHGVPTAPAPYAAIYHDWSGDPFGGGVNFWNQGVRSWEVMARMVNPVADAPVFVCGEAYSDGQGWVEGALHTAELVLKRLGAAPLTLPDQAGT